MSAAVWDLSTTDGLDVGVEYGADSILVHGSYLINLA